MAKLPRTTQKAFGSTATTNQIAKFGSLAAGTPVRYSGPTADPTAIQALGNFLQGWFGAAVGSNSPAEEDMNALFFLCFFQLGYLMQTGVPEWDAATTYYIGSIAQDGLGNLYVSLTDANINHALSVAANWRPVTGGAGEFAITPASSPYTLTAADAGKTFLVGTTGTPTAMVFVLSAAALVKNFSVKIKDAGARFDLATCTLQRVAAEKIENVSANYIMSAPAGEWHFTSDGTNMWITGR